MLHRNNDDVVFEMLDHLWTKHCISKLTGRASDSVIVKFKNDFPLEEDERVGYQNPWLHPDTMHHTPPPVLLWDPGSLSFITILLAFTVVIMYECGKLSLIGDGTKLLSVDYPGRANWGDRRNSIYYAYPDSSRVLDIPPREVHGQLSTGTSRQPWLIWYASKRLPLAVDVTNPELNMDNDKVNFLPKKPGNSAWHCRSNFVKWTLQSRAREGPIGIDGYNSTFTTAYPDSSDTILPWVPERTSQIGFWATLTSNLSHRSYGKLKLHYQYRDSNGGFVGGSPSLTDRRFWIQRWITWEEPIGATSHLLLTTHAPTPLEFSASTAVGGTLRQRWHRGGSG